jgi:RNA polymerase sigma factor (sigma-70 family)
MNYETAVAAETVSQDANESSSDSLPPSRSRAPLGEVEPALLETHVASVYRFVAQRVSNFSDAQDIAQQTLLVASAKLGTCRGTSPQAWLLSIARNLICDHYRGLDRRRCVELDEAVEMETEPALQTGLESVQSLCDSRERLRCWVRCISLRLRLEQQIAVLLADVHGYRDKESAAELGISVPGFKLLLHGARGLLRSLSGSTCGLVPGEAADAPLAPGTPVQSPAHVLPDQCPIRAPANSRANRCPLGLRCCQQVPKLVRLRRELMKVFNLAEDPWRVAANERPELS